ncbi:MAG: glycosyl hydrolase [Mediterranea sp.]|jgi:O-glycosyl hydrolase|nr:glycosyl hydrolase [Mediterranea sp.]
MKKIYLLAATLVILLGAGGLLTACDDGSLSHKDVNIPDPVPESDDDDGISQEPTTDAIIKVLPGEGHRHQNIDGFGCSFGWMEAVYMNDKREQIMDDLYGDAGLRMNIYRGEVMGSYVDNQGKWDFQLDKNWLFAPGSSEVAKWKSDTYNSETGGLCKQMAQLWLIDYLTKKGLSDNIYYFFSVWSPPGIWKTGGDGLVGGEFNSQYGQTYARFLTDFVKSYKDKFGIHIYGISGWNEPDQAMGGWNGCQWTYQQMADFVDNDLRPELNKEGLTDTKVVYGELPWWKNALTWNQNSLQYKPQLKDDNIIAAGHSYSTVAANILPDEVAEQKGIPVWVTETCDDKTRNEDWADAMKWAQIYQDYMTKARVNAIVWWAGARYATTTGENLLQTNSWDHSTTYYRVDRYYSIGQFSRYIPRNATRVDVSGISGSTVKLPKDLTLSAYVTDDTYTIVLVNNSTTKSVDAQVEIDGKTFGSMVAYTSSANVKWQRKKLNPSMSGKRTVTIPKYSVVTLTGKWQ